MKRKTIITTDRNLVVAKVGCKTNEYSIDEAKEMVEKIQKSIVDAENYQPGLHDLLLGFKEAIDRPFGYPEKNKRATNSSKWPSDPNVRAALHIIKRLDHYKDLINQLNTITNSPTMHRFEKEYKAVQAIEEKRKKIKVDAIKKLAEDIKTINNFIYSDDMPSGSEGTISELSAKSSDSEVLRALVMIGELEEFLMEESEEEVIETDDDTIDLIEHYGSIHTIDQLIDFYEHNQGIKKKPLLKKKKRRI